jgi:hypothetical protein
MRDAGTPHLASVLADLDEWADALAARGLEHLEESCSELGQALYEEWEHAASVARIHARNIRRAIIQDGRKVF